MIEDVLDMGVVFFLMMRRPPRSTLFPTRRSSDLGMRTILVRTGKFRPDAVEAAAIRPERSEEHTSELQSRRDLVCRLLLEKKNNTKIVTQFTKLHDTIRPNVNEFQDIVKMIRSMF